MSGICDITVNVDEFLAIDKYEVDEESAHIELADDPDIEEFKKLVRVCPAALYKIDGEPPAHDGRGVPLRVRNRTRSGRRSPQSGRS